MVPVGTDESSLLLEPPVADEVRPEPDGGSEEEADVGPPGD